MACPQPPAFRSALWLLALAGSLWVPTALAASLGRLPLPPADYRYGAATQLTFVLRAAGLTAALLLAVLATREAAGRGKLGAAASGFLWRRWRRLTACLLQRAALGLLLAGLLGLLLERRADLPIVRHPAIPAIACLLLGTGLFTRPLARALREPQPGEPAPRVDRIDNLLDAAPALICGFFALPRPVDPALWALGPFAPWLLPQPLEGPAPWVAAAATVAWLMRCSSSEGRPSRPSRAPTRP